MKHIKAISCILAAALVFSGTSLTAEAAGTGPMLPSGGIGLSVAGGNNLESIADDAAIPIESIIEWESAEGRAMTALAAPEPSGEETNRNLVIAQVRKYVNVRSLPGEEGEIIGKL